MLLFSGMLYLVIEKCNSHFSWVSINFLHLYALTLSGLVAGFTCITGDHDWRIQCGGSGRTGACGHWHRLCVASQLPRPYNPAWNFVPTLCRVQPCHQNLCQAKQTHYAGKLSSCTMCTSAICHRTWYQSYTMYIVAIYYFNIHCSFLWFGWFPT